MPPKLGEMYEPFKLTDARYTTELGGASEITLTGQLIGKIPEIREELFNSDSFKYVLGVERTNNKKSMTMPEIDRVIFNDPATVVIWKDGKKTIVKTQKGEKYDPEKGLAMAVMKCILTPREYHERLEEAHQDALEREKLNDIVDSIGKIKDCFSKLKF